MSVQLPAAERCWYITHVRSLLVEQGQSTVHNNGRGSSFCVNVLFSASDPFNQSADDNILMWLLVIHFGSITPNLVLVWTWLTWQT